MSAGLADTTTPDPAMAAMRASLALIGEGRWRDASDALVDAAAQHREAGRSYDEARCLQLAATLSRAGQDRARADALLQRAEAIRVQDVALTLSIRAEAAEQARGAGASEDALAGWDACLALADESGMAEEARIGLLDRRSESLIMLGRLDDAEIDLARACAIADHATALRLRAETARRLIDAGAVERVAPLLPPPEAAPDPESRAILLTAHARLAAAGRRWSVAADHAEAARGAAREAIDAAAYFDASVELAKTRDALADRPGAYGVLAATWVTLADLLGHETAKAWVEPCLLAFKHLWGDAGFAAARSGYETSRRRILEGID